jgi:hypothetical protein
VLADREHAGITELTAETARRNRGIHRVREVDELLPYRAPWNQYLKRAIGRVLKNREKALDLPGGLCLTRDCLFLCRLRC